MHTLRTILRNFSHNRYYTILNLAGLAIGLSCSAFIMLYVLDEYSFDRHYPDHERIYRLESDFSVAGREQHVAKTAFPLGPALQREFPVIENVTRLLPVREAFLRYKEKKFDEENVFFADSSFFSVFMSDFICGEGAAALTEPNTIVLTRSVAEKYFGDEDPCGKIISYANLFNCKVTAVIPDVPGNTHLKYDALVSYTSYSNVVGEKMFQNLDRRQFFAMRLFTWVKLREDADMEEIAENFGGFYDKYFAELCKTLNATYDLRYTRLDRVHMHAGVDWDAPAGDQRSLVMFILIAVTILLIASVNYMNLATARSSMKVKEVGIRKVHGASRAELIRMFLAESVALAFLALLLSLLLVESLLPLFNGIAGKDFGSVTIERPGILLLLLLAALVTGILSGLYPAFFLSSFKPALVLKGVIHTGKNSGLTRKVLIFFQFAASAAIIASLLVMQQQLRYISKRDLGFDKDHVMVLKTSDTSFRKHSGLFREKLLQNPNIRKVSMSDNVPGKGAFMDVLLVEGSGKMEEQLLTVMQVDYDYIGLMGLRMIAGRDFDRMNGTDLSSAVIINHAAAKELGWEDDAVGRKITRRSEGYRECRVIGVTGDFHYASLHNRVEPLAMFLSDDPMQYVNIRLTGIDIMEAIGFIAREWERFNPSEPLHLNTLGETLDEQYLKEKNLQKITGYFAIISILISLIGLLGLTSFITEKYSKNIGLRKLLGASVYSLVMFLSLGFLKVIALSLALALPVAWILMDRWLAQFAYRVRPDLSWFFVTAILVLLLSFITVIIQTARTALKNPVNAIRYE